MKSILRVILLFLWIGTTCSFSQNNSQLVKEITVYFESASSVISKAEAIKMEEAIQSLTDSHQYSVELSAHTDSEGSSTYNDNLSTQRAMVVADFLVNKGFFNRKISFVAQGENQPIAENETDSGKAQNRRVTVKIQKKFDDKLSVGGFTIEEKFYTFSAENQQKIEHPSGTVIEIPENAFVDKNGNPVTGDVQVSYIEYRDPVDFILGNIPMDYHQDGENFVFNSGGMFKIKATHQGEEVFLGKDKNINLDFPLTENLPDLNFYRFDETTNQWKEEAKNINPPKNESVDLTAFFQLQSSNVNVDTLSNRNGTIINTNRVLSKENPESCYSLFRLLRMGKLMATTTDSLKEKISWTPRKMLSANLKKQKALDFQIANSKTLKNSQKENQKIYSLKCDIKSENGNQIRIIPKTGSYSDKLSAISWITPDSKQYEINSASLLSIKKTAQNLYTITIKDSLGKKELDSLKINDFSLQKETIIANISNQTNNRVIQYNRLQRLVDNNDQIIIKKNKALSKLKRLKYASLDTINKYKILSKNFWYFNKPYMSAEEKVMTEDQWISYFDNNKGVMLNRYKNIENRSETKACMEKAKVIQKAREEMNNALYAENQLRQKLQISNLGIYNCDQIQRLIEPLIVQVDYIDEKGNQITPKFIYIVDKRLNGILKYDGYMNYTPNRFAFSPSSETRLLAFDALGNSYICDKDKMKELKATNSVQRIQLKKIEIVENKDELAALLN